MKTDYQGEVMTDDQVIDTCILLYADGIENVHYGIGNVLIEIAPYEEYLLQLASSLSDAGSIITEALRLNSPAQLIPRIARDESSIHGVNISPGMPVYLSLGSANRDEAVFDQADYLVPGREGSKILTFGIGRHACIGASLATLQTTSLCTSLAKHKISVTTNRENVEYIPRFGHRWPKRVEIKF
ncbi:MAG: cytochrome P450 [Gammaproteobacteria bacterium]|nr:cytochrome P450 [Gammaproteobacteria bacterium]